MRLRSKAVLVFGGYMVGGLGLMIAGATWLRDTNLLFPILLGWCFGTFIVSVLVLRCPHCRQVATLRPNGASTPFVGNRCWYCGEDY